MDYWQSLFLLKTIYVYEKYLLFTFLSLNRTCLLIRRYNNLIFNILLGRDFYSWLHRDFHSLVSFHTHKNLIIFPGKIALMFAPCGVRCLLDRRCQVSLRSCLTKVKTKATIKVEGNNINKIPIVATKPVIKYMKTNRQINARLI